jgi:hypothetical protein
LLAEEFRFRVLVRRPRPEFFRFRASLLSAGRGRLLCLFIRHVSLRAAHHQIMVKLRTGQTHHQTGKESAAHGIEHLERDARGGVFDASDSAW